MRSRLIQPIAIGGAVLGWAALALQLTLTLALLIAQGGAASDGLWRYLGYFTVIANIFASFVLTCAVLRRNWRDRKSVV